MKFGVSKEKQTELEERMARLGIHEDDLDERFVRGRGAGGQKINKTSTAVQLMHVPSGTEIKTQHTRSQAMNRYWARRMLADRLEEQQEGRKSAARQLSEKIRRQKRKRSRRAKAKTVANKRVQGQKKEMRKKPSRDD